jgi:hypothetical protein
MAGVWRVADPSKASDGTPLFRNAAAGGGALRFGALRAHGKEKNKASGPPSRQARPQILFVSGVVSFARLNSGRAAPHGIFLSAS